MVKGKTMILVLVAIVVIIVCIFALLRMNETDARNEQNRKDREVNNAEAIRKYKELLDDGIITQEEFDKKKAELLNNS